MHNDNEIVNYVFYPSGHWLVKLLCVLPPQSFPFSSQQSVKCSFNSPPQFPTPPPLQSSVECLRENLHSLSPQSVGSQLEALVERTEDFTDSAYTSHEQRQAILGLCQLARQDTQQLVHAWVEAVRWHKQARLHRCTDTPTGIFIKTYAAI